MIDARLRSYVAMWTTEKDQYGLLELAHEAGVSCLVFDLALMAPMTIDDDDDDDVVVTVIENMRRAGVRTLTRAKRA